MTSPGPIDGARRAPATRVADSDGGPLARLVERLSPDQRAAATSSPGPVLCVAPAGAGKTTTLVARVAWRVADGVPCGAVCALTFNRRAAIELRDRLAAVDADLGLGIDRVRVRTFHALGLEILRDAGRAPGRIVDRAAVLRRLFPRLPGAAIHHLDDAIARTKLDPGASAGATPDVHLESRTAAYRQALVEADAVDHDDLVAGALRGLIADPALLARWRARTAELVVDEVQDVDASQLRLALLLAAPANRVFLVGDDDQSIYGWRLADVRRILTLDDRLPGLRRFDLVTNRRCPAPVVARAVRLIERNEERFAKSVRARDGATGRIVLVPEGGDEVETLLGVARGWPESGTQAILARTNRELLVGLAVALELEIPFRAERLPELATDSRIDRLLGAADAADPRLPDVVRLVHGAAIHAGTSAAAVDSGAAMVAGAAIVAGAAVVPAADPPHADGVMGPTDLVGEADDEAAGAVATYPGLVAAVVAWTIREGSLTAVATAVKDVRERLRRLSRDDARLTLATAHATKGLEFDDVAVIGMTAGRFPSARSLADAPDPRRAFEEERRLAYVAWTRARRSLTLVYEAADPSPFLVEAFDPDELAGAPARSAASGRGGLGSRAGARERRRAPPRGPPARRQPSPATSKRAIRRMRSSMASRNGLQRSAGSASAIESFGPNAARDERPAARRSRRSPSRRASGIGAR